MNTIRQNFLDASAMLDAFLAGDKNIECIERAGEMMVETIKKGGKIISCGNGGSMCDAMHFAEELSGFFREKREALPAIAISDSSHITCTANDLGFEHIFSRFVEAIGRPGDLLLAFSTSGNSENVINASLAARKKDMKVVGLTGKDGGRLAQTCDIEIRAPYSKYTDRIQEIHIKVIHSLIHYIELNV